METCLQHKSYMSNSAKRVEFHKIASQKLQAGDYKSAEVILFKTMNDYGPHIGLLCDLSTCFYHNHKFDEFEQSVQNIQIVFNKNQHLLSSQSKAQTLIYLGKAYEDLGFVAKALDCYKQAAQIRDLSIKTEKRISSQLLRLSSYLGLKQEIAVLYRQSLPRDNDSKNLSIELHHGLMLAEIQLFGIEHAFSRLQNIVNDPQNHITDKQLCYFDFIEEALLINKIDHVKNVIINFDVESFLEFEKVLFKLFIQKNYVLKINEIINLQSKMPLGQLLRLLVVNLTRIEHAEVKSELQKHILFVLDSVDAESKNLYLKKWDHLLNYSNEAAFKYDGQKLFMHDQEVVLKNKVLHASLPLFKNQKSIQLDEYLEKVFAIHYDESSYHRARIALQRLNKDLSELTGIPKFFLITKSEVTINPAITIQYK